MSHHNKCNTVLVIGTQNETKRVLDMGGFKSSRSMVSGPYNSAYKKYKAQKWGLGHKRGIGQREREDWSIEMKAGSVYDFVLEGVCVCPVKKSIHL